MPDPHQRRAHRRLVAFAAVAALLGAMAVHLFH